MVFFGIKPLYYLKDTTGKREKILAFSSEIKSFLDVPGFKPEVNDEAVFNYLSFQYNPLDQTFFKNVWKLPPAHWLKIDAKTGEWTQKKYWSFEFAKSSPRCHLGEFIWVEPARGIEPRTFRLQSECSTN